MGTRGGAGRLFAMALALAVGLLLTIAGAARAGEYEVLDCGWGVGTEGQWVGTTDGMVVRSFCDPAGPGTADAPMLGAVVAGDSTRAPGVLGGWRWLTPPGAHLRSISMNDWHWMEDGLERQFGWLDGAGGFHLTSAADGIDPGRERIELHFPFAGSGFAQRIVCADPSGGPCSLGLGDWSFLGQLQMTLTDDAPPAAAPDGALAKAGWRRGEVAGTVAAGDQGSGVRGVEALVDGAGVAAASPPCATATIEGEVFGARLQPCPPASSLPVDLETTAFADGPHELRACATDFSGAVGCSPPIRLLVDNTPPFVSFDAGASIRSGRVDAEVSDPTSGPAAGVISYREVSGGPWTELPTVLRRTGGGGATLAAAAPERLAGSRLLFRAEARDGAGNVGSSVLRADGSSSVGGSAGRGGSGSGRGTHLLAWFVDGDGDGERHSAARTVGFGSDAIVRGRLTDANGGGVGGERLRVTARPARGGAARTSTDRVTTRRDGGFALRLPPGTSRLVAVSFAGDDGLAGARSRPLHLKVRSGVSFSAEPTDLRTGETVALSGTVRLDGANVPAVGKLVAIQYLERATERWRPVIVVHSDRSGAFHARYRFRYITGSARIRLRAAVPPEERWPYAAGASRPVTVRVQG